MGRLTAIVLGAAAGGGFPQWNCRCAVCRLAGTAIRAFAAHAGKPRGLGRRRALDAAQRRAGSARAACRDSRAASARRLRASPIEAVVLTGGEIDQTAGLLNLRERQPFTLAAHRGDARGACATIRCSARLAADVVTRRAMRPARHSRCRGGLSAELFTVPGKVPLYLERARRETAAESGANVGVEIKADGATLCLRSRRRAVTPALRERLARADVILFDGTLFTDDEMIASGTGEKTGRRMGHMPIDGADGSLAALSGLASGAFTSTSTTPIRS